MHTISSPVRLGGRQRSRLPSVDMCIRVRNVPVLSYSFLTLYERRGRSLLAHHYTSLSTLYWFLSSNYFILCTLTLYLGRISKERSEKYASNRKSVGNKRRKQESMKVKLIVESAIPARVSNDYKKMSLASKLC